MGDTIPSMAASTAMLLPPEILENIFNQIDDEFELEPGKPLSAASRVCRKWSRSALNVLWRGYRVTSPNICTLHRMSDDGTLAKYLHLIRCLTINDQGALRQNPGGAPRPRKRRSCPRQCRAISDHISFLESDVFYRAESITHVKIKLFQREIPFHAFHKMLPPNIAKLSFGQPITSAQHLDFLKKYAPHLECLKYPPITDTSIVQDRFLDFIGNMPRLRTLHGGLERFTLALLRQLETNTSLRSLRVDSVSGQRMDPIRPDVAIFLKGDSTLPFLHKLTINTFKIEFADQFLPKLPNLQLFKGDLLLEQDLAFPKGFSSLKKLERLELQLILPADLEPFTKDNTTIPGLITLYSSCPSLKYLRIFIFNGHEKFRVTAPEFQKACAALPRDIIRVRLPLWRDWGRSEIRALSRLHSLQEIQLRGIFDLTDLLGWPDAPRLPSVRYVTWNQRGPERYQPWTLDELKDNLRPIFPNLRWPSWPSLTHTNI